MNFNQFDVWSKQKMLDFYRKIGDQKSIIRLIKQGGVFFIRMCIPLSGARKRTFRVRP